MEKLYQISCPKCNNKIDFYRYGKDKYGNQKYQCKKCQYQFAPDSLQRGKENRKRTYPSCPVYGKATYLHHDYEYYTHFTVQIKCAAILFLFQSHLRFNRLPCPACLGKQTLNGCTTRLMLS